MLFQRRPGNEGRVETQQFPVLFPVLCPDFHVDRMSGRDEGGSSSGKVPFLLPAAGASGKLLEKYRIKIQLQQVVTGSIGKVYEADQRMQCLLREKLVAAGYVFECRHVFSRRMTGSHGLPSFAEFVVFLVAYRFEPFVGSVLSRDGESQMCEP